MWSFADAFKYFINCYSSFGRVTEGLTAFNKDIFWEIKNIITHKGPKNMSYGVDDVMTGCALIAWLSIISLVLTIVINLVSFGIFTFSFLVSLGMTILFNTLLIQVMHNHRHSWSGIIYKIFTIIVLIAVVFEGIGIVTSIFSLIPNFSANTIIGILASITKIFAYGMVINGLTSR